MDSKHLERRVLLALLAATRNPSSDIDQLQADLGVAEGLLNAYVRQLSSEGLIDRVRNSIVASHAQRMRIAVKAVALGGDMESVSKSLEWSEFEDFVSHAFTENGYKVSHHFRFSSDQRRWEIDLLAIKNPFLIIAECKHWLRGLGVTGAEKIARDHLARTEAFSEALLSLTARVGLKGWTQAILAPVLISLTHNRNRFYLNVPVVPVLQLPSFLADLPAYSSQVAHIRVRLAAS